MAGTPASSALAGQVDGYIARFSMDGSTLLSSTYLGTTEFDQSYFVQLDTQDDVYVVGQTAEFSCYTGQIQQPEWIAVHSEILQ